LLLLPINGDLWVKHFDRFGATTLVRIFDCSMPLDSGRGPAIDPVLSPDATNVAYVMDRELYIVSTHGDSKPVPITAGAREVEGRSNGLADYLAQEEMDRQHGFWWSHDSRYLAFEHVDESSVRIYRIMHLVSTISM